MISCQGKEKLFGRVKNEWHAAITVNSMKKRTHDILDDYKILILSRKIFEKIIEYVMKNHVYCIKPCKSTKVECLHAM